MLAALNLVGRSVAETAMTSATCAGDTVHASTLLLPGSESASHKGIRADVRPVPARCALCARQLVPRCAHSDSAV